MLGYIISDKKEINVEKYEIQSFDILHKTDLNIFVVENNEVLYRNDIIFYACCFGHVQVLDWFKNSGYKFEYNVNAINNASKNGHIQVLEWFKNSGHVFKYDKYAINWASLCGHVKILRWFKNSGYEFKYNRWMFNDASYFDGKYETKKKIKILKWSINLNVKKVIKWSNHKFLKTIKYKTKNNYIKGYNKN